jgi:hypothetical protein
MRPNHVCSGSFRKRWNGAVAQGKGLRPCTTDRWRPRGPLGRAARVGSADGAPCRKPSTTPSTRSEWFPPRTQTRRLSKKYKRNFETMSAARLTTSSLALRYGASLDWVTSCEMSKT